MVHYRHITDRRTRRNRLSVPVLWRENEREIRMTKPKCQMESKCQSPDRKSRSNAEIQVTCKYQRSNHKWRQAAETGGHQPGVSILRLLRPVWSGQQQGARVIAVSRSPEHSEGEARQSLLVGGFDEVRVHQKEQDDCLNRGGQRESANCISFRSYQLGLGSIS
jgi:hypothetical protein